MKAASSWLTGGWSGVYRVALPQLRGTIDTAGNYKPCESTNGGILKMNQPVFVLFDSQNCSVLRAWILVPGGKGLIKGRR